MTGGGESRKVGDASAIAAQESKLFILFLDGVRDLIQGQLVYQSVLRGIFQPHVNKQFRKRYRVSEHSMTMP
jgi:hypothetical protein